MKLKLNTKMSNANENVNVDIYFFLEILSVPRYSLSLPSDRMDHLEYAAKTNNMVYVTIQALTTGGIHPNLNKIVSVGICVGYGDGVLLSKQQFYFGDIKWPTVSECSSITDYGDFDKLHWYVFWQCRSPDSLQSIKRRCDEATQQKPIVNEWDKISDYLHHTVGLTCVHDGNKRVGFIRIDYEWTSNSSAMDIVDQHLMTLSRRKLPIENLCTNCEISSAQCSEVWSGIFDHTGTVESRKRIHRHIAKVVFYNDTNMYNSFDVEPVDDAHVHFLRVTETFKWKHDMYMKTCQSGDRCNNMN